MTSHQRFISHSSPRKLVLLDDGQLVDVIDIAGDPELVLARVADKGRLSGDHSVDAPEADVDEAGLVITPSGIWSGSRSGWAAAGDRSLILDGCNRGLDRCFVETGRRGRNNCTGSERYIWC